MATRHDQNLLGIAVTSHVGELPQHKTHWSRVFAAQQHFVAQTTGFADWDFVLSSSSVSVDNPLPAARNLQRIPRPAERVRMNTSGGDTKERRKHWLVQSSIVGTKTPMDSRKDLEIVIDHSVAYRCLAWKRLLYHVH